MQKINLQTLDLGSLRSMKVAELRDIAGKIGIKDPETIHKVQLRQQIIDTVNQKKSEEEKKSRIKKKQSKISTEQKKNSVVSKYYSSDIDGAEKQGGQTDPVFKKNIII